MSEHAVLHIILKRLLTPIMAAVEILEVMIELMTRTSISTAVNHL